MRDRKTGPCYVCGETMKLKSRGLWECPKGHFLRQPDLFDLDDASGRGTGWRAKDRKPSEYEATLARRLGMTTAEYAEWVKRERAKSHEWLEAFAARVHSKSRTS